MENLYPNSTLVAVASRPVEQIQFKWNVENMKDLIELFSAQKIHADVAKCQFSINSRHKADTQYRLKLDVILFVESQHFYISWGLCDRKNCPLQSAWIKFESAILDKNGKTNEVAVQTLDMKVRSGSKEIYGPSTRIPFMEKYFSELETSLTFIFKVTYCVDNQEHRTSAPKQVSVIGSIPHKTLKDFQGLLGDRDTADVEIIVTEDKTFFCHKAVLCARSLVFRKMITVDMKEKAEARVVLDNISAEAFEQFIHFLYCGSFKPESEEGKDSVLGWLKLLPELIDAAEQYDMEDLKEVCDANLSRLITKENTLDMIRVVKVYKLKKAAVELANFMSRNPNFLLE